MDELVTVLDRLLDAGATVDGGVLLSLAGVELARLNLRLQLTGASCTQRLTGRALDDAEALQPVPAALPPLSLHPAPGRDQQDALTGLVVGVAELLHRVLETQALARFEAGSLTDEQAQRLGRALAALDIRVADIRSALAALPEGPSL